MELTKEIISNLPGLCELYLGRFAALDLPATFTARQAVEAYLAAGGSIPDIARVYGAMVSTGLVEDTGAVWRIAGLAFAVQSEDSGLRAWAETLGLHNWEEAQSAANAAAEAALSAARAYAEAGLSDFYAAAEADLDAALSAAEATGWARLDAVHRLAAARRPAAAKATPYARLDAPSNDTANAAAKALYAAMYAARRLAADDDYAAAEDAAIKAQESKILQVIFAAVGE